jgi:DNA-binding CsgD family transcriptional regulator
VCSAAHQNPSLPTVQSFFPALRDPRKHIRNDQLHGMSVQTTEWSRGRIPWARTGHFGAVFKFEGAKSRALKVFTTQLDDRGPRYHLIDRHLRSVCSTKRLVSFRYDDEGIRVGGSWLPTLVMDWSTGTPLSGYIESQINQGIDRRRLCREWAETVKDLKERDLAHGDLQHENILVLDDGTFQLIDYDGMFVPSMAGRFLSAEVGLPAYQHPSRRHQPTSSKFFNISLDDFSALIILLSLAAVDERVWGLYHKDSDDRLIVSADDLRSPSESRLLCELSRRPGAVGALATIVTDAASQNITDVPSFQEVIRENAVANLLNESKRLPTRTPPWTLLSQTIQDAQSQTDNARPATSELSVGKGSQPPGNPTATEHAARGVAGSANVAAKGQSAETELSRREIDVAHRLARDLTPQQISQELGVRISTVNRYLAGLRRKAGAMSNEELALWARNILPADTRNTSDVRPTPSSSRNLSEESTASRSVTERRSTGSVGRVPTVPPSTEDIQNAESETAAAIDRLDANPGTDQDLHVDASNGHNSPDDDTADMTAEFDSAAPLEILLEDESDSGTYGDQRFSAEDFARWGVELAEAQRTKEATIAFDKALLIDESNLSALVGRAEANLNAGENELALRDANTALKLNPKSASIRRLRARIRSDRGQPVRAWFDRIRANLNGDSSGA